MQNKYQDIIFMYKMFPIFFIKKNQNQEYFYLKMAEVVNELNHVRKNKAHYNLLKSIWKILWEV